MFRALVIGLGSMVVIALAIMVFQNAGQLGLQERLSALEMPRLFAPSDEEVAEKERIESVVSSSAAMASQIEFLVAQNYALRARLEALETQQATFETVTSEQFPRITKSLASLSDRYETLSSRLVAIDNTSNQNQGSSAVSASSIVSRVKGLEDRVAILDTDITSNMRRLAKLQSETAENSDRLGKAEELLIALPTQTGVSTTSKAVQQNLLTNNAVTVQKISLVDANGDVRMELGVSGEQNVYQSFYDGEGNERVIFGVTQGMAILAVNDESGANRVRVAVPSTEKDPTLPAGITVASRDNKAVLALSENMVNGVPAVQQTASFSGQPRYRLSIQNNGAFQSLHGDTTTLLLMDKLGKVRSRIENGYFGLFSEPSTQKSIEMKAGKELTYITHNRDGKWINIFTNP